MEGHDTRTERLGIQELQCIDTHLLEDARSFSESKWKHQNAQFIHETLLEHGVSQLAYAILQ